tara:strand:- start:5795 stop:6613 length:819 start_codon:yes stop_codon:yes gene_type:complete
MDVGVIGRGFVGGAIYKFLSDSSHTTYSYDITDDLDINDGYLNIIENCEIIYLCLPTPMDKEGRCYIDIVENSLSLLDRYATQLSVKPIILIKSTLVPGSTYRFQLRFDSLTIVANPEFLTERNAEEDFRNSTRHILGIPLNNDILGRRLENYYRAMWPNAEVIKVSPTEAELIKYLINSYLSVRVGFANHMFEICSALNIDYNNLIEIVHHSDSRLGSSHWKVPGPDGKFGFGGSCFPKDLSGLIKLLEDKILDTSILKATQEYNSRIRNE